MTNYLIIAGIGSRETPREICKEMVSLGKRIAELGGFIRTGHADGADWAFERGARERSVIYLPFKSFNNKKPVLGRPIVVSKKNHPHLEKFIDKYHPAPHNLSQRGRDFMRRNTCQILGINADKPVSAVVCWTKDGKASGGTGQALRIAEDYRIPIANMKAETFNTSEKVLNHLIKLGAINEESV